jgi:hypothetical protein
LRYLRVTQEGQQWIANLYANVFSIEHSFYEPWQRWFDLRVYPSRDGGLSIYFQDATDRKKAEEVLRRLNETLERQPQ